MTARYAGLPGTQACHLCSDEYLSGRECVCEGRHYLPGHEVEHQPEGDAAGGGGGPSVECGVCSSVQSAVCNVHCAVVCSDSTLPDGQCRKSSPEERQEDEGEAETDEDRHETGQGRVPVTCRWSGGEEGVNKEPGRRAGAVP